MDSTDEMTLFDAALSLAHEAAAHDDDGEGVAAAAFTDRGDLLTGVWVDAMVDSACLCAETGPICEAHRTRRALTASICVHWTEATGATVLAACGVCQERLAVFGVDTLVGVGDASDRGFRFATIAELRPSPWWLAIGDDPGGG